jgi:hypothetical protein
VANDERIDIPHGDRNKRPEEGNQRDGGRLEMVAEVPSNGAVYGFEKPVDNNDGDRERRWLR